MSFDIDGIHHTGILTRDLDALQRRFTDFGFTLSPRSRHYLSPGPGQPVVAGSTANHCVLFGNSYIELLGIVDESAPDPWHALRMADGFRLLNLNTNDAAATDRRLTAAGFATSGVLDLEREVDTEDGPRTMRARAIHLDPRTTPEAYVGLAQHLTREYVHQPRYLEHPNGARGIGSVLLVVADADFDSTVSRYVRLTGNAPYTEGPVMLIETGSARLEFAKSSVAAEILPGEPVPAASYLASMTILVDDADKAREIIEDTGIPTIPAADGFFVSAHDSFGAALHFAG